MADATEDPLPSTSTYASSSSPSPFQSTPSQPSSNDLDNDPTDEAPDFRFLASLNTKNQSLPRRGEKDFEPHKTRKQEEVLEQSRNAMRDALSHTRKQHVGGGAVGVYDAGVAGGGSEEVGGERGGPGCWILQEKGKMFTSMGVWVRLPREKVDLGVGDTSERAGEDGDQAEDEDEGEGEEQTADADDAGEKQRSLKGRLWLLPEEALYLLERGALDIRYPLPDDPLGILASQEGLPMSLQGAYAAFIGRGGLTLEMYTVYTGLKRLGYTVLRHTSTHLKDKPLHKSEWSIGSGFSELWRRMWQESTQEREKRIASGPLITPGLYRSYKDQYRLLTLIPFHDPSHPPSPSLSTSTSSTSTSSSPSPPSTTTHFARLPLTFSVWKPSTPYKKRSPPPADFLLSVIPARETTLPSLAQLDDLLARVPWEPPSRTGPVAPNSSTTASNNTTANGARGGGGRGGGNIGRGAANGNARPMPRDARLKHGYRSVVLAVVDQGVTSFLRWGDAGFGCERVYEDRGFGVERGGRKGRGGGGGYRGGRGGRGGGRGRGT
ncbi:hypothetical protein K402DRAFT_452104 [Aulographum hederae CBS 113979]|uniref:tRNA-splicing endonuclease subunit Sen54 N-terminal domain-containing protein n=1 Tax=Aulographum hederae CBS 113979 TaxID=1176131 RepID=A0A6G1H811_9PEZI|nr:hypothetical protein K402DRAFT_452104 [Aulographum hederae CBS 113979]